MDGVEKDLMEWRDLVALDRWTPEKDTLFRTIEHRVYDAQCLMRPLDRNLPGIDGYSL